MSRRGSAGRCGRALGAALCLAVLAIPTLAQAQGETTTDAPYPAELPAGDTASTPAAEATPTDETPPPAETATSPTAVIPPPPAEETSSPDLQLARPPLIQGPEPATDVIGGAAPFQRKHATASFAVGAVGIGGFGAGFAGTFAWDLTERYGIELALGVGGMQERGGGAVGGWYADVGAMIPITFNICASVPRVCPALDFEITIFPGLAYAYLDGDHAGNVILGFGVSSLRKTQSLDVGVRASILAYLDVVGAAVEASADRLLGLVQLQLGCIVRWGVAQP